MDLVVSLELLWKLEFQQASGTTLTESRKRPPLLFKHEVIDVGRLSIT